MIHRAFNCQPLTGTTLSVLKHAQIDRIRGAELGHIGRILTGHPLVNGEISPLVAADNHRRAGMLLQEKRIAGQRLGKFSPAESSMMSPPLAMSMAACTAVLGKPHEPSQTVPTLITAA